MSEGGGADESRWNKFFDRSLIRVGRCEWEWEGPVKSFGWAEQRGVTVTLIYFLFFFLFFPPFLYSSYAVASFGRMCHMTAGGKKSEASSKVKLKRRLGAQSLAGVKEPV